MVSTRKTQYRSVVSTLNTPTTSTQPSSKPKLYKMISARNPFRRMRRLQDISESSSSEFSKLVHEETTVVPGKKASTSHFNNVPLLVLVKILEVLLRLTTRERLGYKFLTLLRL